MGAAGVRPSGPFRAVRRSDGREVGRSGLMFATKEWINNTTHRRVGVSQGKPRRELHTLACCNEPSPRG